MDVDENNCSEKWIFPGHVIAHAKVIAAET